MQVGLRAVFEHIGARVSWRPRERTAYSVTSAIIVEVPAGSQTARVNGRPVDMGKPSTILEKRMFIPLTFFASVTDSALQWDQETQTASVTMGLRALAAQP
jgi:hypothetical protein